MVFYKTRCKFFLKDTYTYKIEKIIEHLNVPLAFLINVVVGTISILLQIIIIIIIIIKIFTLTLKGISYLLSKTKNSSILELIYD